MAVDLREIVGALRIDAAFQIAKNHLKGTK